MSELNKPRHPDSNAGVEGHLDTFFSAFCIRKNVFWQRYLHLSNAA